MSVRGDHNRIQVDDLAGHRSIQLDFLQRLEVKTQGVHSLLYFAYTSVRGLFIRGGVIYLAKRIIRFR